jgi:hypothetical protein
MSLVLIINGHADNV